VILGADIVRWLLSTGGIIVIFLIVCAWVYAAGRASKDETRTMRRARRAALAFAIAVAIFSIYGLEYLFARVIVGSMKPFNAAQITPNKRTAIVLLGSGSWHAMDWDGRIAVYPDPAAASRELEAARVFRLVNPAVVISSGGNPHPHRPMVPGGEAMREHLVALGVPADRILVETESGTTRDEALIVDRMLKAQGIEQVALGDDARAGAVGVIDHSRAHLPLGHQARGLSQRVVRPNREDHRAHPVPDLHCASPPRR